MNTNGLHISDCHGNLPAIPKILRGNASTTLLFTGDICPNNIANFTPGILDSKGHFEPTAWNTHWNFRKIDTEAEAIYQNNWIETEFIPYLHNYGITKSQIIILRGNHDWADFEKYFPNALNIGAKTINYRGKKIGLLAGSNNFTGEWQDEIDDYEFNRRIQLLDSDIEILLTHQPPYGIRDKAHGEEHIGSQALYKAIFGTSVFDAQPPYFNQLILHCFGHAHSYPNVGATKHEINGRNLRFVNAAENRIEITI